MPNDDIAAAFVASGGAKLPAREAKVAKGLTRSRELKAKRRPRDTSVKQAIDNARWAGIREATIYWLNRLDPDGAHCFECGQKAQRLDADHIVPKGKGGHSSVSNCQLLCRPCHSAKHGVPQFSKVESEVKE